MNHEFFAFPFFSHEVSVTGWKLMGSLGALMFAGRWVIQFFHARRAGRAVTPIMFWVMSVIGSSMMLIYFVFSPKQDMVGIMSNFLPSFVAAYNLYLELRHRARGNIDAKALESKNKKKDKDDDPTLLPLSAPETVS